MLNEKIVRKIIRSKLEEGIKKFVIYPFGANGLLVKKCLTDVFNIEPILIIDNIYAKYNLNIKDDIFLKKNYDESSVVLLTIEDNDLNLQMEKYLYTFIPKKNVINLPSLSKVKKESKVIIDQFSLNNILPNSVISQHKSIGHSSKEKVKVRFLHSCYVFWNAIKTICEAFKQDEKYDVLIILREDDSEIMKKQMKREGYSFVLVSEYDVKVDLPDIIILHHPWERTEIKNCREYTNLIIAASMMLIRYSYDLDKMWTIMKVGFGKYRPDYYLFDSLLYEEIKNSKYYSEKIIEMGNAKFDGIYSACTSKKIFPAGWEKLKGKKIILWCTDHGLLDGNEITDYITFDLYAKFIFQYAFEHTEVGFIMRLHRSFIRELVENCYWGLRDLDFLRQYCQKSRNIIWDESDTYDISYSLSDAILTDALCGITCSALPTLKPICVMYRNRRVKVFHKKLINCYYSAYTTEELLAFFIMVEKGEDTMFELRKRMSQKYIKHFDGKNGERIKAFIEDKYFSSSER